MPKIESPMLKFQSSVEGEIAFKKTGFVFTNIAGIQLRAPTENVSLHLFIKSIESFKLGSWEMVRGCENENTHILAGLTTEVQPTKVYEFEGLWKDTPPPQTEPPQIIEVIDLDDEDQCYRQLIDGRTGNNAGQEIAV